MALHEQCVGATDEWYTPPHVFETLRCKFDLDVASPGAFVTPWIPARNFYTHSSLIREWHGLIWMNPPFGGRGAIDPWLEKFFAHGNGIALTPDRTSAPWWQRQAAKADAILFVAPKLKFIGADGKPGKSPAQGTTLMAAGSKATRALFNAADRGLGIFMIPAPSSSRPIVSPATPRTAHPVTASGAPGGSAHAQRLPE
jgi:hypothetical protein